MSIAGKILAVFNVLAALAAFIYFLPTSWGTRHSWAYAYYRHDLVLDGLPLDKDEKDTEGYLLVDKMSETTRRQVFQSAGTPVNTQMDEIEGVRSGLRSAAAARLTEILANMARTGPEREEAKANEDPLKAIFEEVDKAKDPASKRAAIARVLFNSYNDNDKEKRLPVIIGLKEFAREINQEADAVVAMTARVRRGMQRDLASFEASYPRLIKDIQIIAEKIEDTKKQLEVQEQLSKSHNSLVMKRTQDVAEIKKSIYEAKEATKKAMKTLTNEQKLLHQAEAEVGKRAKENEDLEKEIRRKEGVGASKER
jgi:hypothetical protein